MSLYPFFNEYPYRNISDTNLDWIFKSYSQIINDIKELQEWAATHKVEYAELKARVDYIATEIETFEQSVNNEFARLKTQLEAEFAALKADVAHELQVTKEEIENDFNQAIAEFTADYEALKASVESEIQTLRIEFAQLSNWLATQVGVINENVIDLVNAKLQEFINNLPDYENLIVYNPVEGRQTNVQTAINDLYVHFNIYGITARQYDSLNLTAEKFDALNIDAITYDSEAYVVLGYPDTRYYMRDPFTGLISKVQVVILELANLHKEALTAAEYDALDIDADSYDAMELTAYFFDWYGVSLRDGAIIASDYDALDLTAAEFDAKEIRAINYDKFGHDLLIA